MDFLKGIFHNRVSKAIAAAVVTAGAGYLRDFGIDVPTEVVTWAQGALLFAVVYWVPNK